MRACLEGGIHGSFAALAEGKRAYSGVVPSFQRPWTPGLQSRLDLAACWPCPGLAALSCPAEVPWEALVTLADRVVHAWVAVE